MLKLPAVEQLGLQFLATIHRAMVECAVFHDTPMTPWRDPLTQACLDRVCTDHVSCIRREAWCAFETWFRERHLDHA